VNIILNSREASMTKAKNLGQNSNFNNFALLPTVSTRLPGMPDGCFKVQAVIARGFSLRPFILRTGVGQAAAARFTA
jgi:hypothetical protein